MTTVYALMRRAVTLWGDREAVVCGDIRRTFAASWRRGAQLANGLLAAGVGPRDRVAVLEDNDAGAADVFVACTIGNFVRVPLYARNAPEHHAHMLANTQCRALIVSEAHAHDVDRFTTAIDELDHVLVRDGSYEDFLGSQCDEDPHVDIREDDWYIVRHTAGTTGKPKGVPFTHRTWLANARDWFFSYPPIQLGDACLHVGPISHGSGYFFTPTWISGGRNILVPKFDPRETIELMEAERVAYMFAVPTIVNALASEPTARQRDLSSLKVLSIGGAPISPATAMKAHDVFGDTMHQIYGQTEAGIATTLSPREWFAEVKGSDVLASVGRPHPFAEVEVRDLECGSPVRRGEPGEIAVRSDAQMPGFWNNAEATAERVVDGWILTGDVGRFDDNGYLYILDRANDMIISGGFNIYPAELEAVVARHPAVREVAAFSIPNERWGEAPAVHVCVTDVDALRDVDVVRLIVEELGSYKKPSTVVITTDELPKSPAGKILRKALRDPYWSGSQRRVSGA